MLKEYVNSPRLWKLLYGVCFPLVDIYNTAKSRGMEESNVDYYGACWRTLVHNVTPYINVTCTVSDIDSSLAPCITSLSSHKVRPIRLATYAFRK